MRRLWPDDVDVPTVPQTMAVRERGRATLGPVQRLPRRGEGEGYGLEGTETCGRRGPARRPVATGGDTEVSKSNRVAKETTDGKLGQVRMLPVAEVWPSPENDQLYLPVNPADPEFQALVRSVKRYGVREPLVVTRDSYIVSGHRRHAAARRAGLKVVPCRVEEISRLDPDGEVNPEFLVLLREHNRQRVKTLDEVLREEIVSADPEEAHRALVEHRKQASRVNVEPIEVGDRKRRAEISKAKRPFLDAIQRILEDLRDYWPLSIRLIHYNLLNDPPLKHARKPGSCYDNTLQSYKSADELIVRARFEGLIPFEAIDDKTRSVVTWSVHQQPATFIRQELDGFLKGYYRDLMQSQPSHVEIVGEKNTVEGVIRPAAM